MALEREVLRLFSLEEWFDSRESSPSTTPNTSLSLSVSLPLCHSLTRLLSHTITISLSHSLTFSLSNLGIRVAVTLEREVLRLLARFGFRV